MLERSARDGRLRFAPIVATLPSEVILSSILVGAGSPPRFTTSAFRFFGVLAVHFITHNCKIGFRSFERVRLEGEIGIAGPVLCQRLKFVF